MTYDITMCNGKGCKKRATCLRVFEYNKWRKTKTSKPQAVTMVEVTEDCDKYKERITINGKHYEPKDTQVEILKGLEGDCIECDIFEADAPYKVGSCPACCEIAYDDFRTVEDNCIKLLLNDRINRVYKQVEKE